VLYQLTRREDREQENGQLKKKNINIFKFKYIDLMIAHLPCIGGEDHIFISSHQSLDWLDPIDRFIFRR